MECLTALFSRLLSMGWTALPVMAVVLGARWLLRRAPKRYAYLLWAVVAFRLVCPVTVSTPIGLVVPDSAQRRLEAVREAAEVPAQAPVSRPASRQPVPENAAPERAAVFPAGGVPARRTADPLTVGTALWLAGMFVMAGYVLWSFLCLRRLVRTAVRREGDVWECDALPTPFVLGLLRPRIYIPFRMTDTERAYVLAHEREHLRWGDPWVKALALGILIVYWWHPGVWLCWVLLCRDMELRCDEAVLASLGDGVKQDYSRSLLSFALDRRFPAALAFGEHDAERRVKHVLAWKQAKPAAIFLALAAVVMVTAVCGTNAADRSGSWIRSAGRRTAARGPAAYTYQFSREAHAFLLYQERYDRGELTGRNLLAVGDLGGEDGQTAYRGSLMLDMEVGETPRDRYSILHGFQWDLSLGSGDAGMRTGGVEDGPFTAIGWYSPFSGRGPLWGGAHPLRRDCVVAVASLSREENGELRSISLSEEGEVCQDTLRNEVTVLLRLRLGEGDADALLAEFEAETETALSGADTLARQLYYASRTPEAILDILGAEETLGRYTIEDAPHSYLSMLFYDCPMPLPDRDTALWKYSMVLLALLDDYQETTWNWIDGGVQVRETNGGLWNTRDWLNAHGLGKPIREYGGSPEALRKLLGTLYPDYGGGAPVSETGEALYALQGDLSALIEAVVEPVLGEVSWTFTEGGILELSPAKPLASLAADGGEGIVSDLSCLLLALTTHEEVWSIRWLDGGVPVEFSYLHGGDPFMENAAAIWTEHRSGDILDIHACGRSAAGMTLLAEDLGVNRILDLDALRAAASAKSGEEDLAHTAAQIFALSTEETPDGLIDDLICWDYWGIPGLSGKYRKTLGDGTLLLEFPTDGGDANALDQAAARNAAVLLRLRPEITAVRWTYPDGDGRLERTFDTGALSGLIALSSNSAVYRRPQSAEEVQALLHFLWYGLGDRVFTAALEGRDIPRQSPFTDVLGHDGFLWDLQEGFFRSRTWYAVEEGREPFPIAETYGYDPPEAYEVDLDGDGERELICNYVTGGDGHPGVHVYQRRANGVYEGYLSTRDLPGHDDWGINSTWERYDPETGRFVIGYDAGDGGEKEAVFTPAEALKRMEWTLFAEE